MNAVERPPPRPNDRRRPGAAVSYAIWKIGNDDWMEFGRLYLNISEDEILRYQGCCPSEETKYQALLKSFERNKRRFVYVFRRDLTRTLRGSRYRGLQYVPNEIDPEDMYDIIERISNKNWMKFARTKLKLRDHEIVPYGDFELTKVIKTQMLTFWLRRRDNDVNSLMEKVNQFLYENPVTTEAPVDIQALM